MKKLVPIIWAVISFQIMGCASVGVTRLAGQMPPPKPANCHLDIYTDVSKITRPYEDVCLIDSRTGTTLLHKRTASAAIEKARPAACRCGADALIVGGVQTKGISMTGWGMGAATIKAIRYVVLPVPPL